MTMPLIETAGLCKYFQVKQGQFGASLSLKAVDGVDLYLGQGETLGLAGESGCGKSTVGKLLLGLIKPTAGVVNFCGRSLDAMNRAELADFRRQAQMIFQDPYASLNPRQRVADIIGEPLAIHALATGSELQERVRLLMTKVGLDESMYHRYPHEFSGGQRQRIGIARALAVSPRLIVADEPVSALDLSIQAQIINLLQELKSEFSLSFLFIAHDLAVIRHLSDRVAIMYLGRIVEIGDRESIFTQFRHPYTEALLSAVPSITRVRGEKRIVLSGDPPSPLAPASGCPFHPRCRYAKELCRNERPPLEEKLPAHFAACHFSNTLFCNQ